jgi:hypothetical protein
MARLKDSWLEPTIGLHMLHGGGRGVFEKYGGRKVAVFVREAKHSRLNVSRGVDVTICNPVKSIIGSNIYHSVFTGD